MADKPQYRLNGKEIVGLLAIALVADLLTLIPFVGIAVGPIFWVLMNRHLNKKGLGGISGTKGLPKIISAIAEVLPVVQELPTIFAGMSIIIIASRIEDKTGVPVTRAMSQGKQPAPAANFNGRREAFQQEAPLNIVEDGKAVRPPNGNMPPR